MKFFLILLSMLFCHIVDDYYLRGILANMKQKSWWRENAPDKLYKNDYIMALFMHSFSWSFMIMVPIIVCILASGAELKEWLIVPYFWNAAIHAGVDDLKANKKMINLIQDQIIHLVQIVVTWIAFVILM